MKIKSIYNPREIEPRWQKYWRKNKVYQPDLKAAKKPFYNLMMFPYPSAEGLHMGNMYAFTGADVHGRFKRMQGFDVFQPIGLDGFGIHSENYAIKVGRHPKDHAKISEKHFYEQLHMIGDGFAWDQKLETYDPEYYRWTQWLFVQMYKNNLAYRKEAMVNWCPSCKTVLSDEQVEGGVCERCKTPTTRKETEQWFFKITAYADQLLNNIPKLNWPKKITVAQQNWIGRSEGVTVDWKIEGNHRKIDTFTTRLDTIFGVTFLIVAPDHPIVGDLLGSGKDVMNYLADIEFKTEQQRKASEREKSGVQTDYYAIHPLTGDRIPIWIADFVLAGYGTGAIMGVPAHDQRDFEFAITHGLPIKQVVLLNRVNLYVKPWKAFDVSKNLDDQEKCDEVNNEVMSGKMFYEGEGILIDSENFNGMDSGEARGKIFKTLEMKNAVRKKINYHLRDWLISRQRYWGPPIPMIFCTSCAENQRLKAKGQGLKEDNRMLGWNPPPEDQLPVLLPDIKDFQPKGDGKSPLRRAAKEWLETACPKCGGKAKRETDVSDTFLDSSWYFLRYPSVKSQISNLKSQNHSSKLKAEERLPWDLETTKKWLPVNAYIGGAEHAVLHLLYSRFVWMALSDWGYLPKVLGDEPFPFLFSHGLLIKDGAKMSKSRGNVVNPDEYIGRFGADALRMYLMFLGPYNQGGNFRDTGMAGMYRFLERIWKKFQSSEFPARSGYAAGVAGGRVQSSDEIIERALNKTIKKVSEDISKFKYNTAIAALMEFMNEWEGKGQNQKVKNQTLSKDDAVSFLKLMAPIVPHLADELYHTLVSDAKDSIHREKWPSFDAKLAAAETARIAVQVNGKTRVVIEIEVEKAGDQNFIEKTARGNSAVKRHLANKMEKQVIFVSGKILNFVVE